MLIFWTTRGRHLANAVKIIVLPPSGVPDTSHHHLESLGLPCSTANAIRSISCRKLSSSEKFFRSFSTNSSRSVPSCQSVRSSSSGGRSRSIVPMVLT
jgi:hypothetical protein